MIWIIDHLPATLQRKILSREYSGAELEERLKLRLFQGWHTFKAIHRMASINMFPALNIGDQVGSLRVRDIRAGTEVYLSELAKGDRPLVLNFGSCT